jgi:hypothetical protein
MLNTKKIKMIDLWHYKGCWVVIDDELANEYVPVGSYIFLKSSDVGLVLFDGFRIYYYEDIDDTINEETEVEILCYTPIERMNNLLNGNLIYAIESCDDVSFKEDEYFSLTTIENLALLKRIVGEC